MAQSINGQQLRQLLSDPQQLSQAVQQIEIKTPNEADLAKQAFGQMAQSLESIAPNSISLFTVDKQAGSVGLIQGTNMVRAFVSKNQTDKQGYKIADVVDFVQDDDGQGIKLVGHETSPDGGVLVDEQTVDPTVLKAIIKHVRKDAQVKRMSIADVSKPTNNTASDNPLADKPLDSSDKLK